jgi:hypothetical protein
LHDSLMARLDRLAPVKEVAQIGAVIGREFSYEVLAAVAPMSANQLCDALEQLVNSELVFRRDTPPEATYTFKASAPVVKSTVVALVRTIVSLLAPPVIDSPEPKSPLARLKVSSFAPPSMVSAPVPPVIASFPPEPFRTLVTMAAVATHVRRFGRFRCEAT